MERPRKEMVGPPVLSYADERGLLEELEQAASGQLSPFLAPRSAQPAATTRTPYSGSGAGPPFQTTPSSPLQTHHQQRAAFLRSPSKPLSRRDEIEAESVLDIQNVEVAYAQIMTKLGLSSLQGNPMDDCLRASLAELEGFCLKQSFQLQGLCQKMMHNTMKYVSYKTAAAEMRQEAATWCLVRHLFFESPVFDLAKGAASHGAVGMDLGMRTSMATQVVTESILGDAAAKDLANVVSWLEFLAGLDLDESPTSLPKVGAGDGVWDETKTRCAIGSDPEIVTALDPDAPARQGKALTRENAKDNERILRVVWTLLRCGRIRDACNICRECGQPWRAASLAVSGGVRPTPVGEVAMSQSLDPNFADKEFEAAADECDVEPGLRRFLWKLACHAISEEGAKTASPEKSDISVAGVSPTYEAATYGALCGNTKRVLPVCSSWEDVLWALSRGLLEQKVDDTIGELTPLRSQTKTLWLEQRLAGAPKTMAEVVEAMDDVALTHPHVAQEGDQMQRQIQVSLILKNYKDLLEGLRNWILHPSDHQMGELTFAEPPASPGTMRFAAHLILFLRFLGIVDFSGAGDAQNEFSEAQDLVNKILQVYIIHLMDTEQHDLIPVYAAHLRETSLDLTYMIFLDEMMKYSLVEQEKCYVLACKYLGEAVPRLACKYATKVMQEAAGSIEDNAEHRANACLWLCYEETMFHSALQHSVALCRDLSLGGTRCYEAASMLLLQVLPVEFWKWLEVLKFEGTHADVNRMDIFENDTAAFLGAAKELEDWREWFDFQDSIRKWNALWQTIQPSGVVPGGGQRRANGTAVVSASNAQSLRGTGERLMDQAMGLLTKKWLQTEGTHQDASSSANNSALTPPDVCAMLTCMPVHKPAGQEGIGFAADAVMDSFSPDVLEVALNNALRSEGGHYAAAVKPVANGEKMEVSVYTSKPGPGGEEEEEGDRSGNLEAAAYIIGWAIKGNLSESLRDVGLNVQHLDCGGNQVMCQFICRQICMSKLVLQCIFIRQVLSTLAGGNPSDSKGQGLIQTIVGAGETGVDLTHYLSPFQVQELLLMERDATINELEKQNR